MTVFKLRIEMNYEFWVALKNALNVGHLGHYFLYHLGKYGVKHLQSLRLKFLYLNGANVWKGARFVYSIGQLGFVVKVVIIVGKLRSFDVSSDWIWANKREIFSYW